MNRRTGHFPYNNLEIKIKIVLLEYLHFWHLVYTLPFCYKTYLQPRGQLEGEVPTSSGTIPAHIPNWNKLYTKTWKIIYLIYFKYEDSLPVPRTMIQAPKNLGGSVQKLSEGRKGVINMNKTKKSNARNVDILAKHFLSSFQGLWETFSVRASVYSYD